MQLFNLKQEEQWSPERHVEKILGRFAGGDVSIACWLPGQTSPYHCHPEATEVYFCFEGGGKMRTPERTVDIVPGSFIVHPPGDVHEYSNGPQRTLLFRVRWGASMVSHGVSWDSRPGWKAKDEAIEFFRKYPERLQAEIK